MSDPLPPPSSFLALLPTLGIAFLAGALTQLSRQLARPRLARWRLLLAGTVAAGITAACVVALLCVQGELRRLPEVLLAAACIGGWTGPALLTRLGAVVERRLGLPDEAERPGPPG